MFRSFIPLLLASLGFILFGLVIDMPLFEWQISEITTQPPYEIRFNPSPWTAKLGDSLEDDSVIFYQFDISHCGDSFIPEKLKSVVRRSWSEEVIERITRNINRDIFPWLWLLLFLCGSYVWWYAIRYKRPIAKTFISSVIALIFICILINLGRPFYASVGSLGCLEGTITFNAKLSKTHYETLLVLFAVILAEVGAIGIMLRQIIRAVPEGK